MGAPLLPSSRLTRIRQRWEDNMPETCLILPATDTRDVGAEDEITYPDPTDPLVAATLVSMKCRLKPVTVQDTTEADQRQRRATWLLQCPVASRISPTDRLYVTGVDASGGSWSRTLDVVGMEGPRTWEAVRVIRCTEVLPITNVTEEEA